MTAKGRRHLLLCSLPFKTTAARFHRALPYSHAIYRVVRGRSPAISDRPLIGNHVSGAGVPSVSTGDHQCGRVAVFCAASRGNRNPPDPALGSFHRTRHRLNETFRAFVLSRFRDPSMSVAAFCNA